MSGKFHYTLHLRILEREERIRGRSKETVENRNSRFGVLCTLKCTLRNKLVSVSEKFQACTWSTSLPPVSAKDFDLISALRWINSRTGLTKEKGKIKSKRKRVTLSSWEGLITGEEQWYFVIASRNGKQPNAFLSHPIGSPSHKHFSSTVRRIDCYVTNRVPLSFWLWLVPSESGQLIAHDGIEVTAA